MIVIIATKILPGEAGGGNNFRMLISRRRTPIDFEHAVTLSACDRAWHGAPSGEFWLRDELFEDGIVEYVDRGSRSHSVIYSCATSQAACSAESTTAGRALLPPIRSSDRRKLTFQAMWGTTQTERPRGHCVPRGSQVRRRAPTASWPCPPIRGGCPDGSCCERAP